MTPQLARRLLGASAVLGVLANWLLTVDSWRAGFVLWVLVVLGVALAAERARAMDPTVHRERRLLYGSAATLAMLLVLRDAPLLYAFDFLAFLVVMFLVAWRARGRSLTQLEPRDACIGVAASVTALVAGAPTLALRDASATEIPADTRRSSTGFGIGTLAAAPVLLVVALLLVEADPLFAGLVERTGVFLEGEIIGHLLFVGAATWVTAGALRGSLIPVGLSRTSLRGELRLSFATVTPLLGGLSFLLSAWIGLQVRTLFGGAEYVADTAGVTVASYARQGFFELIVIAGIVLAALLVVDDVLDRTAESARGKFRILGQVLVGLVGAVLLSAVIRLSLYLRFYGLTEDRVMALLVLTWVALVLAWFAMSVLRGVRARFAPGVLVLSAMWLGVINVANPERWIVETNVRRAERGLDFDVAYHAKLSGDAVPTMLATADRLGPPRAAALRAALTTEWEGRAMMRADWRRWSLPYAQSVRRMAPSAAPQ